MESESKGIVSTLLAPLQLGTRTLTRQLSRSLMLDPQTARPNFPTPPKTGCGDEPFLSSTMLQCQLRIGLHGNALSPLRTIIEGFTHGLRAFFVQPNYILATTPVDHGDESCTNGNSCRENRSICKTRSRLNPVQDPIVGSDGPRG